MRLDAGIVGLIVMGLISIGGMFFVSADGSGSCANACQRAGHSMLSYTGSTTTEPVKCVCDTVTK